MLQKTVEATILQHLLEFADQLKRNGEFLLREFGLTPQQWLILLHLVKDPNLPFTSALRPEAPVLASQLAGFFNVSRANITNHLNALIAKELIVQTEDAADRRRKMLDLTEAGRNLVKLVEPQRHLENEKLFSSFSDEEKTEFLSYIQRCLVCVTGQ